MEFRFRNGFFVKLELFGSFVFCARVAEGVVVGVAVGFLRVGVSRGCAGGFWFAGCV